MLHKQKAGTGLYTQHAAACHHSLTHHAHCFSVSEVQATTVCSLSLKTTLKSQKSDHWSGVIVFVRFISVEIWQGRLQREWLSRMVVFIRVQVLHQGPTAAVSSALYTLVHPAQFITLFLPAHMLWVLVVQSPKTTFAHWFCLKSMHGVLWNMDSRHHHHHHHQPDQQQHSLSPFLHCYLSLL